MERIKTDQIGYQLEETKKAVFPCVGHCAFVVMNISTNDIVYQGTTGDLIFHGPSGQKVSVGDFSTVTAPGAYCIFSDELEPSYPFQIGDGAYFPVLIDLFRMFYLQRCGMRLKKEYAREYAHACCHAAEAVIYGTNEKKEVNGGWHDAGDYGRYVVAGAVAVADLLLAWQENQPLFDRPYQIPNNSGLPDFLEEIKYELDWMLKMQDEKTGGVYHKVTCERFPGFVMPEKETEQLVISPISSTATADFAGVFALAYEVYREFDKEYANKCLSAAKSAYEALLLLPSEDGFHNPEGIVTGEYGDSCDVDERYWASAELYRATGEKRYHDEFKKLAEKKIWHGFGWEDVGSFGNHAYLACEYPVDDALWHTIKKSVTGLGEQILENCKSDAYGISLEQDEYIWGSNMLAANRGLQLCEAYHYKKNKEFMQAAKDQVHYLFGKNPLDICYVTGAGSASPEHPHHRPSAAKKKAMPGMLVGGPDSGLHDDKAAEMLKDVPPAKCYIDELESYSTNEITIYWNAPLIYLIACIQKEK